jgi:hypothetical protein
MTNTIRFDIVGGANDLGSDIVKGELKITVQDGVKAKAIKAILADAMQRIHEVLAP